MVMAEPNINPADRVTVPSVDELRQIGRERLMTYFVAFGATPPDNLDDMARAAHELLLQDAARAAVDWEEYIKQETWVPMKDVLRELGIPDAEGPANESAA
jgi:hypothetical protein